MNSLQPMLNIAEQAALAAGKVIIKYADRIDSIRRSAKGYNDLVTEVDLLAERAIIDIIRKAYPEHAILSEEATSPEQDAQQDPYKRVASNQDLLWIIDPLDGTLNFSHGFPFYNVSIALLHKQQLQLGVIFDPVQNELFTASRGGGALLNQKRIRVSQTKKLGMGLIGTGFPFKYPQWQASYLQSMGRCMAKSAGIRRAGAGALDLAYVACGRLDGFWELGLQPWDMAAGMLLIQEAGGIVQSLTGDPKTHKHTNPLHHGHLIAANPQLIESLHNTVHIETSKLRVEPSP